MREQALIILALIAGSTGAAWCFEVESSEQPASHPPLAPRDGAVANTNPSSMTWRVDDRAATYTLEMSRSGAFEGDVVRVEGIDMPLYNHSEALAEGMWYWRYLTVTAEGEASEPSLPRSFRITEASAPLPVPPTEQILAEMPDHPRVFVTPDTLEEFRARREGPAREAWEDLKYRADKYVDAQPPALDLRPMPASRRSGGPPWARAAPSSRPVGRYSLE